MNELSIVVEQVALSCVLAVRCTAWMNFVYSSCLRGVSCRSSVVPHLPPWFRETRRPSASSKSSMMEPSMIVSSSWRNWWPQHCCCTNSQRVRRGLLAGGKIHKGSMWRVDFIIIIIIIFLWGAQNMRDISPQGLWILEHATAYQGEVKLIYWGVYMTPL
jgi:hypothetical protein